MSTTNTNENCNDSSLEKTEPQDNDAVKVENYVESLPKVLKTDENLVVNSEEVQEIGLQNNQPEKISRSNPVSDRFITNVVPEILECILANVEHNYSAPPLNIPNMICVEPDTASTVETPNRTFSGLISDEQRISNDINTKQSENLPDVLVNKVSKLNITDKKPTPIRESAVIVVNKESDSLRNLLVYDDDDSSADSSDLFAASSDSESDTTDIEIDANKKNKWHNMSDVEISATSESEDEVPDSLSDEVPDSLSDDTDGDVSSEILTSNKSKGAIKKGLANKKEEGELLPPVPDLSSYKVNVEKEEFMHIGHVDSVIEKLVTIEAIPGTPAFDIESCLFIEDKIKNVKKTIGEIFDVLGPVTSPLYCVRFNSPKDIEELKLTRGVKVFVAPKNQYTKYVFVKELMQNKGSDASWLNDAEVPPEMAEFSDDEAEREARKSKTLKRKHGSLERHQRYEQTMNKCNTLNTRVSKLMDAHQHLSRSIGHQKDMQRQNMMNNASTLLNAVHPAPFNPSVPPPGFGATITTPLPRQQPTASHHFHPGVPPIGPPGVFDPAHSWAYPQGAGLSRQGQNNSANYHTNNGRSYPAGPSSYHPF